MSSEYSPQVTRFLENRRSNEPIDVTTITFPAELLPITERLGQLSATWNPVEIVTASAESIKREKARVFAAYRAGQEYNPVFDYPTAFRDEIDPDESRRVLEGLLQQVRGFKPQRITDEAARIARAAVYYKLKDDLATVTLLEGIRSKNEAKIKQAMGTKYASPDQGLVELAHQIYEDLTQEGANKTSQDASLSHEDQELLRQHKVDAAGIKTAFEWLLNDYGILRTEQNPEGFSVEVTPEATGIDVRDKSKRPMTIYIPTDRQVTADKLLELMYHEIEGHARQSMNGIKLVVGGGRLRIDDETWYEALAKRLDEKFRREFFGTETGKPLPFYTLAIAQAEKGASFAQIFKEQVDMRLHVMLQKSPMTQLDYESQDVQSNLEKAMNLAWTTTYRVMRGHTDTSNPDSFAFAKDLAYLRGWLLDQQLRSQGLGHYNEVGVLQTNALALVGRLAINYDDLEYPFKDATKRYCTQVLLPQLRAQ